MIRRSALGRGPAIGNQDVRMEVHILFLSVVRLS
jgi:hypothetical protein